MTSIFISYSRRDIDCAEEIVDALAKYDLDTWIDWKSIPKGEDWESEIYRGIEDADVFLFLISPDSVQSEICNREITHAAQNNKRVIPIVIRDADINSFHSDIARKEISRRNWVFYRNKLDRLSQVIDEIITTIHTDYEWLRYHTKLQIKALEWDRNHRDHSLLLRGKELQDAETQLVSNTSKEPYPTNLQRDFVLDSRQTSNRQRRNTSRIAIAVAITMGILAIYAFIQAQLAEERANIALARQLAAQAQFMDATGNSQQTIAVLLAIRSMQLLPSAEAAQILQKSSLAPTVTLITHEASVMAVAFSPDSKYVASGSYDNIAHVWEVASGKEVSRVTHGGVVDTVSFSPDGKYILSISRDDIAHIWEASSGKEIADIPQELGRSVVAFSPDGQYIAARIADNVIRIWEPDTDTEIARLSHEDRVESLNFSPDGTYLISGGRDKTVHVWDVITGQESFQLKHNKVISSVRFSPNGRFIFAQGDDRSFRVWEASLDMKRANLLHEGIGYFNQFSPNSQYMLVGPRDDTHTILVLETETGTEASMMTHDDRIGGLAFSPDSKYVVSGSWDRTVRVWEARTGKEITRVTHDSPVDDVVFSPDGRYVASASNNDHTARVWEVKSGKEIARASYSSPELAFSPDGKYLVSPDWPNMLRVWEATSNLITMEHSGKVRAIAISGDGNYIASGSDDNTARVWEASTGKEISQVQHENSVTSIGFSADAAYVVSASDDHTVRVWAAETGKEIARLSHDDRITFAGFIPGSEYVLSTSADSTVRIWEAHTGVEITRMHHDAAVTAAAFSSDGKYIVSGSNDKTARVWEVATGKQIASFTHDGIVTQVAFSPNTQYVISSSLKDNVSYIYVWKSRTGEEISQIGTKISVRVNAVTFSPDNYYMAWENHATVNVWETETQDRISEMMHDGAVYSIAFSPDSKFVASGSLDRTLRVWEASRDKEIARLIFDDPVYFVAFTQNGEYVIVGSGKQVARWRFQASQNLVETACNYVSRNLTRDEWKQYLGNEPYQAVCPDLPIEDKPTLSEFLYDLPLEIKFAFFCFWLIGFPLILIGLAILYRTRMSRKR